MNKPIRVLQIMGIVESGGVEAVIMNYYQHIDREKVQFDFIMHKGANAEYVRKVHSLGGKVYEITSYSKNIFKFTYEIYKIIKTGKYNIIHCNLNALSGFPLLAAYLAGAEVRILHNHTTDNKAEGLRTVIKRILRPFAKLFANQYWACSKLAAEWMYGRQAAENGKVTIINNAIDLEKFAFDNKKREQLRKTLNLKDKFVVGHVGRFMKQKNHDFLIDIFVEVSKKNDKAVLILIGDGPLKQVIENKVNILGLSDKVIFLGVRNDVADLYNAMDVFVLPSLYEGLPVVGVEVQANGLPFICSANITDEIVISEKIYRCELNEGAEFWSEMILKFSGKERCKVEKIFNEFDIKVQAKELEKKYEELL